MIDFGLVWIICTVVMLGIGSMAIHIEQEGKSPNVLMMRWGTRMIKYCWAWPVLVIIGLYCGIRKYIRFVKAAIKHIKELEK